MPVADVNNWRAGLGLAIYLITMIFVGSAFELHLVRPFRATGILRAQQKREHLKKTWNNLRMPVARRGQVQESQSLQRAPRRAQELPASPGAIAGATAGRQEVYRGFDLVVDQKAAPSLAVAVMLSTTIIDGSVLRRGVTGVDDLRPYDVLVLFIVFAYISTALHTTGFFRYMATKVARYATKDDERRMTQDQKERRNGKSLFSFLYFFWFMSGVLFGNDPIILSGTPFLASLGRIIDLRSSTAPSPWIFSQFTVANIASAVFVSSNPTNVVVAGGFQLNYLTEFPKFTVIPTILCALVAFCLSFSVDRKALRVPSPPRFDGHVLKGRAMAQGSLIAVTLVVVWVSPFFHSPFAQIWLICGAAGVLSLLVDLTIDLSTKKHDNPHLPRDWVQHNPRLAKLVPNTAYTFSKVPWDMLLFGGGVFVLNFALTSLGWTSVIGKALASVCVNPWVATLFIGYLASVVLCPLCGTNIGATILLVETFKTDEFKNAAHIVKNPKILWASVFSATMATNLGAFSITLSSSLAGLLWQWLLVQDGYKKIGNRQFAKRNILFLVVLIGVSSLVVAGECYWFSLPKLASASSKSA
ncbi:hypothetical protein T439DRAFT_207223 [Meredithblackwellia eburnea MCA 4105]